MNGIVPRKDKIDFMFTGPNQFFIRDGIYYFSSMSGFSNKTLNFASGDSYIFKYDKNEKCNYFKSTE